MDVEKTNCGPLGQASTAALEQRYIDLLERRIKQLEARLDESDDEDSSTQGSAQENNKFDPGSRLPQRPKPFVDGNATPPKPDKAHIHVVVSKFDPKLSKRQDFNGLLEKTSTKAKYPVIFRRVMDEDIQTKVYYEELDIAFVPLKDLLREHLPHLTSSHFDSEIVNFRSPFRHFVWRWEELTTACKPHDTDDDSRKLARGFLKEAMAIIRSSEFLDSYFKNYNHRGSMVAFDYIWTLFEPGTMVIGRSWRDQWQMFQVQGLNPLHSPSGITEVNALWLAAFDWTGDNFVTACYIFYFRKFEGSVPISSLEYFPVRFYQSENGPASQTLIPNLVQRGKRFSEICTSGNVHHKYDGPVIYHLNRWDPNYDLGHEDDRGLSLGASHSAATAGPRRNLRIKTGQLRAAEVIVDNSAFMGSRRSPGNGSLPLGNGLLVKIDRRQGCPCQACKSSLTQTWAPSLMKSKAEQVAAFRRSEAHLSLLPPRVLGYSLKHGLWAQMAVDNVQRIVTSAESIDESFDQTLIMEETSKSLLKALVKTHHSNKGRDVKADFIEGKGRGLVILLHGPPGVGKTLTAETVALATGKPLMSVSTAEIGLEPELAEKNLADIFEDAGKWEAVLLMDEADIFLEERRGTRDLKRNALVGVLLRVLEYYDGIIILTTNRITSLDVAVESRIHLAIKYLDLKETEKMKIFEHFLDHVIKWDNVDDRDGEMLDRIKKLVRRSRINGRQIRNIITSANLLAKSQKKKLGFEHIEEVHDATVQFLESLKDLTREKRMMNEGSLNA